jgi:hypothetical protein
MVLQPHRVQVQDQVDLVVVVHTPQTLPVGLALRQPAMVQLVLVTTVVAGVIMDNLHSMQDTLVAAEVVLVQLEELSHLPLYTREALVELESPIQ